MCEVGSLYASANVKESSKDIGKSCFRMYLINVWRRKNYEYISQRQQRSDCTDIYHHNLSAVREVEIADPIVPQEFPDLHQTVTLL